MTKDRKDEEELIMHLTSITSSSNTTPDSVPVVLDHFAHPDISNPVPESLREVPGYNSLLSAYRSRGSNVYVKISGQYRIVPPSTTTAGGNAKDPNANDDDDPAMMALKNMFFDLLQIDPTRLVWGSDWPHTRFEGIDTVGWARTVVGWCQEFARERPQSKELEEQEVQGRLDEKDVEERARVLIELIFKTNADELWLGRDKAREA
jgi:hypothetical protein